MILKEFIPEPFSFNPLKHHLGYMKSFISECLEIWPHKPVDVLKDIRHIGASVMDIYSGNLGLTEIFSQVSERLEKKALCDRSYFLSMTGEAFSDFMVITLSDSSDWTLKYNPGEKRWIHIFPVRSGPLTFRIKANTLRSAVLYLIISGKDYVRAGDLNSARALIGLPPVKSITEAEAISGMIGKLRD